MDHNDTQPFCRVPNTFVDEVCTTLDKLSAQYSHVVKALSIDRETRALRAFERQLDRLADSFSKCQRESGISRSISLLDPKKLTETNKRWNDCNKELFAIAEQANAMELSESCRDLVKKLDELRDQLAQGFIGQSLALIPPLMVAFDEALTKLQVRVATDYDSYLDDKLRDAGSSLERKHDNV